jgi:hypothetical protein
MSMFNSAPGKKGQEGAVLGLWPSWWRGPSWRGTPNDLGLVAQENGELDPRFDQCTGPTLE